MLHVEAKRPREWGPVTLHPYFEVCASLPRGLHLCHWAGTPSLLPLLWTIQRSAQASLAKDKCRHVGHAPHRSVVSDSVRPHGL